MKATSNNAEDNVPKVPTMKTKRTFQTDEDWGAEDEDNFELESNGSSAFGQVLVLVILGFILLVVTNVIEIQGGLSQPIPTSSVQKTENTTLQLTSHRPVGLTKRSRIPQDVVVKSKPRLPIEQTGEDDGSTRTEDASYSDTKAADDDTITGTQNSSNISSESPGIKHQMGYFRG